MWVAAPLAVCLHGVLVGVRHADRSRALLRQTRVACGRMQLDETMILNVTLTGCGGGVGVGLDSSNRVDMLKPGMPAIKGLSIGDLIVAWNGIEMVEERDGRVKQKLLKDVVCAADTHTITVERTRKPWETATWETDYAQPTTWDSPSW